MVEHLKQVPPYDAVFGFSQGAAIASLLSDTQVLYQHELESVLSTVVILYCGAGEVSVLQTARHLTALDRFTPALPSCHITGLRDEKKAESEAIVSLFTSSSPADDRRSADEQPFALYVESGHEVSLTALHNSGAHLELKSWLTYHLPGTILASLQNYSPQ